MKILFLSPTLPSHICWGWQGFYYHHHTLPAWGRVLDDILQRGGISSLSTRGWYFNAHLLKHDFCSQFSRLADKETAEGRHLLSP